RGQNSNRSPRGAAIATLYATTLQLLKESDKDKLTAHNAGRVLLETSNSAYAKMVGNTEDCRCSDKERLERAEYLSFVQKTAHGVFRLSAQGRETARKLEEGIQIAKNTVDVDARLGVLKGNLNRAGIDAKVQSPVFGN